VAHYSRIIECPLGSKLRVKRIVRENRRKEVRWVRETAQQIRRRNARYYRLSHGCCMIFPFFYGMEW